MNMKVKNQALYQNSTLIVDVRTVEEYDQYHIEHAINMPIFTHQEREHIGTVYKNQSQLEAKKLGVKYISYKIENIMNQLIDLSENYHQVIIYCQRGGMRSGTVVSLLNAVGQGNVFQLEDGIKGHRQFLIESLPDLFKKKTFITLHGHTGVGKTKLLNILEDNNLLVLDYEGIAQNAGSVFGTVMYQGTPPSQKQFEEKIFDLLMRSNQEYAYMESESKRVGTVIIPTEYMDKMTEGRHILIETTLNNRVVNLIEDYKPSDNHEALIKCVNHLRKRISNQKADELIENIQKNQLDQMVSYLLTDYYDPMYQYSIDQYQYDLKLFYKNINDIIEQLLSFNEKGN
ncbi:MAG: tRNA 2-selenouridine(34) synthase MnmH [Clostridia bacterium]|nr:tRNA 2-selenouridine(34) synthase MnmH [Clostridia bacterium]